LKKKFPYASPKKLTRQIFLAKIYFESNVWQLKEALNPISPNTINFLLLIRKIEENSSTSSKEMT
jgi:hypothetical protein